MSGDSEADAVDVPVDSGVETIGVEEVGKVEGLGDISAKTDSSADTTTGGVL